MQRLFGRKPTPFEFMSDGITYKRLFHPGVVSQCVKVSYSDVLQGDLSHCKTAQPNF